jgi:hypothetical protein
MQPMTFLGQTVVVAEHQPPYLPLPAYQDARQTISAWSLTFVERLRVLFGANVRVTQLNFGRPLQPLKLEIDRMVPR